jgi:hypothetical protein
MDSPGAKGYLSDAGTAAAYAFFEHLPDRRAVRRDLPRWLTRDEFLGLREAFRYHLSAEEFTKFEAEFLEARNGIEKQSRARKSSRTKRKQTDQM